MRSNVFALFLLLSLDILFCSWGYVGHQIIGENSTLSFNEEMNGFNNWKSYLSYHSSDADKRKLWDESEGIKHYIDIDNYPGFVNNGQISQNIDTLINEYGLDFIIDQGTLPWATLATYDLLVNAFKIGDFEKALNIASDLSHYVADGYMPLHLTRNYNGQLSGNDGIHSRYESKLIGDFENEIIYTGGELVLVNDVSSYIFEYIYSNYLLLDSILIADDLAQLVNLNTSSNEYYNALWSKTKIITIDLFEKASLSLAQLIYTAWKTAGSPIFEEHTFNHDLLENENNFYSIYENSSNSLSVSFHLEKASNVEFIFTSMEGKLIYTHNIGLIETGKYIKVLNENISKGLYIFTIKTNNYFESKKIYIK